jgi:1,4-dihydroxy-2-naphthoate octaprenyltransferase
MSTEGRNDVRIDPRRGGSQAAISSQGLASYLQSPFSPLFLGIVGITALFYVFTHEINPFVQLAALAVVIRMAVVFYTLSIVRTLVRDTANAHRAPASRNHVLAGGLCHAFRLAT